MNIFATYKSPIKSAQVLDDKRVIKMILESAQMLSTAIFINSNEIYNDIYKPTHIKHPCTIWTSSTIKNWKWLYDHFKALCSEYTFRFAKIHKSKTLSTSLILYKYLIPKGNLIKFPNCCRSNNIDYTNIDDVHSAYKKYLVHKWKNDIYKPKWTKRPVPTFFN